MTVLITRSAPGSDNTAKRLQARGIPTITSPTIQIQPVPALEPDWSGVQAVLVTSAAGARGVAQFSGNRQIPVFAVGEATGALLRELGFSAVTIGPGDARGLATLAEGALVPDDERILHVRGEIVAFDPVPQLRARGFQAEPLVVYQTCVAASLSEAALSGLRLGAIKGVLFHSKEGAEAFLTLVSRENLLQCLASVSAFAISARVASALDPLAWREVCIANACNEDALLALIA